MLLAETQIAVMLNDQAGEMTSALAARNGDRFWTSVRACLLVLAFAIPVYAFYYYMRDRFANQWRRWLTGRFLDGYLKGRKYYRLRADSEIDNLLFLPGFSTASQVSALSGRGVGMAGRRAHPDGDRIGGHLLGRTSVCGRPRTVPGPQRFVCESRDHPA